MTRAEFQARIAELIARGYSPRAAERTAKRERRLHSPQHKAAVARRMGGAADRFEATGNVAAFKVLEGKR
jgi:hypothetical protein